MTDTDKTFSQEDVNRIVSERLAKEKGKLENAFEEREKELAQREFKQKAVKALADKGLPANLLEALNTSSEEAFNKSLLLIEKQIPQKSGGGGFSDKMPPDYKEDATAAAMGIKAPDENKKEELRMRYDIK